MKSRLLRSINILQSCIFKSLQLCDRSHSVGTLYCLIPDSLLGWISPAAAHIAVLSLRTGFVECCSPAYRRSCIAYIWLGSSSCVILLQNPTANERKEETLQCEYFRVCISPQISSGSQCRGSLSLTESWKSWLNILSLYVQVHFWCCGACKECLQKQFVSIFSRVSTVNAVSELRVPEQASSMCNIYSIYREIRCILYYWTEAFLCVTVMWDTAVRMGRVSHCCSVMWL